MKHAVLIILSSGGPDWCDSGRTCHCVGRECSQERFKVGLFPLNTHLPYHRRYITVFEHLGSIVVDLHEPMVVPQQELSLPWLRSWVNHPHVTIRSFHKMLDKKLIKEVVMSSMAV